LFACEKVIHVMGAHNGLSAKLVERNNFDAVWASGLEISASCVVPDANILTMTQYLEKSIEMNEAVNIPIISDCDTGYGNSSNVICMVKKYESAGIAAVCIEDKLFPKVNSFIKGRQELASIAEFVGKIMAAKSTQKTQGFMLIARIEALIAGWGEQEALLRADKYVEAGADAILIHSKSSDYEEAISFAKKWDKKSPLVIVPTTYPEIMRDLTDEELLDLGIKMVIYANQGIRASVKAMNDVMSRIRKDRQVYQLKENIVSLGEVFELQGMTEMRNNEKKYLMSTATNNFNVIFLAAGSPKNQESLEPLLRERPVSLLDINGQSLIRRNINTVNQAGATDVTIVAGYCAEQFDIENVNLINNPDYKGKSILHSLILAQEKLEGKTLMAFADTLFDKNIIENLIKCESDVVLVVDATFKKMNARNKTLDLVKTDRPPQINYRVICNDHLKKVLQIDENISQDSAHYEFVGLALFNKKGAKLFKDVCSEMMSAVKTGNVLKSPDMVTINDILQEMINRGFAVFALEVNSGWMEIHTFENYKTACSLLA